MITELLSTGKKEGVAVGPSVGVRDAESFREEVGHPTQHKDPKRELKVKPGQQRRGRRSAELCWDRALSHWSKRKKPPAVPLPRIKCLCHIQMCDD